MARLYRQAAVIPFRIRDERLEIALVTTLSGKRWVVPKGSPYVKMAHEVINFALGEGPQEKLLALQIYGPVLGSAAAKADDAARKVPRKVEAR